MTAIIEAIDHFYHEIHNTTEAFGVYTAKWETLLQDLHKLLPNQKKEVSESATSSDYIIDLLTFALDYELRDQTVHKLLSICNKIYNKSIFAIIFHQYDVNHSKVHELLMKLSLSKYHEICVNLLSIFNQDILTSPHVFQSTENACIHMMIVLVSYICVDNISIYDTSSKILVDMLRMLKSEVYIDILLYLLAIKCQISIPSSTLSDHMSRYADYINRFAVYMEDAVIKDKVADSSVELYRYYALFSELTALSDGIFIKCQHYDILSALISVKETNDILGLMVTIDYYIKFSETRCGREYVVRSGLLNWLLDISSKNESDRDYDSSIAPQALRVFTGIVSKLYETHSTLTTDSPVRGHSSAPHCASAIGTEESKEMSASLIAGDRCVQLSQTQGGNEPIQEWLGVRDQLMRQFTSISLELFNSRSVAHRLTACHITTSIARSSMEGFMYITSQTSLMNEWACAGNTSGNIELQAAVFDTYSAVLDSHLSLATADNSIGKSHLSTIESLV